VAALSTAILLAVILCANAHARVIRLTIERREKPAYATSYERLTGHFEGELEPADPHNSIINDIKFVSRARYVATFTLLRPIDAAKTSGVMWYEVPNRGNSPLNPQPSRDALVAGHILVSSGWQGDLSPRPGLETITVPIAQVRKDLSITGPVLARLMNLPAGSTTASLDAGFSALRYQRPVTLDTTRALLTKQASDDSQQIPIAPRDWAFANCESKPFPGEPDPTRICIKGGFQADLLYQLTYTAKDPLVLGMGLAATRDLVSYLRYESGPENPVAGMVRHAIAFGTSQSGNFIKTFVHLGFNQDEAGRIVWDGVNPNIAARQNPLNFRFAIPGGAANLYEPGSEAVLWWGQYNAVSLLDRCRATNTCPKVIETFGSSEFWGLKMSPGLVGTSAYGDIPLPPEVRRYYFPGVSHGGAPGRGCVLADNPNSTAETMRVLRQALTDWVVKGIEPPPSRYPLLASGELVPPVHTSMGFPVIPGKPLPDNLINTFYIYDFGPGFKGRDLSGWIAVQPPAIRGTVPLLVPRTDSDGNEVGGVASVTHQVPLGTYLGWNVTASGYMKGRGCGFAGGFIPFARTKEERVVSDDPRPSLEERYGTHEAYVARVREAARRLAAARLLLADDAERIVREAEASAILK
jgi:hypothetical protein